MGREKNKRRELDNEAKVVLKNIRVSPQKLNLVAQMIRKETASKAISILQFSMILMCSCAPILVFRSLGLFIEHIDSEKHKVPALKASHVLIILPMLCADRM